MGGGNGSDGPPITHDTEITGGPLVIMERRRYSRSGLLDFDILAEGSIGEY